MDKLNIVMAVVKKHHFWVLNGLIVVLAAAILFMSGGKVAGLFDERKTNIQASFTQVEDIRPGHPNDNCVRWWNDRTEALKENVLEGWKILYDKQKQDNKLGEGANLSEECKELLRCTNLVISGNEVTYQVENENTGRMIPRSRTRPLYERLLGEYQDKIGPIAQALPKGINIRQRVPGTGQADGGNAGRPGQHGGPGDENGGFSGGESKGQDPDTELRGIVEWPDKDQLLNDFTWPDRPSLDMIKLAQENLWVYQALLRIIADTNAGISDADYPKAPIKRIDALEIGRMAAQAWQNQRREGGLGTGGPAAGGAAAASSHAGAAPAGEGAEGPSQLQALAQGRYIDQEGNPLPAGPDGAVAHPNAEFKRMPVRMKFLMNQMSIPDVLAACANSSMPIEVKRVRFNPGLGRTVSLGEDGEGGNASPAAAATGQPRPGEESSASGLTQPADLDVTVEIQGIIYIYNPPDLQKLGTGTDSEQPVEGAGPAPGPATDTVPGGPTGTPETTPSPAGTPPADGT